jgi:hypothetical protein
VVDWHSRTYFSPRRIPRWQQGQSWRRWRRDVGRRADDDHRWLKNSCMHVTTRLPQNPCMEVQIKTWNFLVLELFHPLALMITVLLLPPGDLIRMNSGLGSLGSAQHANNAHRGSNQAHATIWSIWRIDRRMRETANASAWLLIALCKFSRSSIRRLPSSLDTDYRSDVDVKLF